MAPALGLNVPDPVLTQPGLDAIDPSYGPFELLAGSAIARGGVIVGSRAAVIAIAKRRNVEWIRNASRDQLQKKFKHAEKFGVSGNANNKNLDAYKKALEDHVRSADTEVIRGTYHGRSVTHYYNTKTNLNIIRNSNGEFISGWKLEGKQVWHMKKTGNLGGGK